MSTFNPNTPSVIGSEVYPTVKRTIDLGANPLQGIAQRFVPGQTSPYTQMALYDKGGGNSKHGVDIVQTLVPQLLQETLLPGTDTGKIASAQWVNEAGGANTFDRVAKPGTLDNLYLTMTGGTPTGLATPVQPIGWLGLGANLSGGCSALCYRFNRSALYKTGGFRVVSVTLNARVATTRPNMAFQFLADCYGGGASAEAALTGGFQVKNDGVFRTFSATLPGDPGTMIGMDPISNVNGSVQWRFPQMSYWWDQRVTTGGPYTLGILPYDTVGGGGGTSTFQCSGIWITVTYCTENRVVCAYAEQPDAPGWNTQGADFTVPSLGPFCGGPNQRMVIYTSSNVSTNVTLPALSGWIRGDVTANDVGATLVDVLTGVVIGTVSSVSGPGGSITLTGNAAASHTTALGLLGTAPANLATNQYYYAVHSALPWTQGTSATMDVLQDPALIPSTQPTQTNAIHFSCYDLVFSGPGSFVPISAVQTVGELVPIVPMTGLSGAPVVDGPAAQPYVDVQSGNVASYVGGTIQNLQVASGLGDGQQITTAAATTYSAVIVAVGQWNPNLAPDQPLSVEIRHGVGATTGGGTLDASGLIYPSQLIGTGNKPTKVVVPISFVSILNTQYVVYFRSSATPGQGWTQPVLIVDGGRVLGSITAGLLGLAGIGGTTDAFLNNAGAANFAASDTPAALVALPGAPTTPSALAVAAT